jgi:EAL domain-containing protein (putative c-di-GMP-specific phosphodiesterase class I)
LSVELLLRWDHPSLGRVSPAEFIPIAEDTGQMSALGRWVIQEAARCYQSLKQEGCCVVPMSINVSAQQLNDDLLVDFTHQTCQDAKIPPSDIMIEVTESAIMSNENKALATLNALKALGYDISVDDFGTGYACLSYIQKISPSEIKIDQHFIADMLDNIDSKNIVAFTLGLANSMKIEIVAEGVETQAQLALLQSMGSMKIQGYLLSRPVPLETFKTMLLEQEA